MEEKAMTFSEWYSANVPIPVDAPAEIKKASREMMAGCWNAAIDATEHRLQQTKLTEVEEDHDGTVCTCFMANWDIRAK